MRTNIVLDGNLVAEAMKLSQITTKRQAVEQAFEAFVAHCKRLDERALKAARSTAKTTITTRRALPAASAL